jgi:hypothetical protein
MQMQNCVLQKSEKNHLNGISQKTYAVYLCKQWTQQEHKSMPSYHLHISNDAEEICTGNHVEIIVAQWATTGTTHCITKQENYLLSHQHLQWT